MTGKTVFAIFLAALTFPISASAQQTSSRRVAVFDLKAQGVESTTAATLTGVLLAGLSEGGGLDLLGKSDLASILNLEQSNMLVGCLPDDPRCVVEHGQALGNAILIWGTVGKVGNRVVINVAAVDVQAGTTLGRGTRSVDAADGEAMVESTTELAAEIRAALGLSSQATWSPIMALALHLGTSFCDYSGATGTINTWSPFFEAEVDLFLTDRLLLFFQTGLGLGIGEKGVNLNESFTAWIIPVTIGAKYRWIRPWLTPYAGAGIGLGFLQLSNLGGAFNIQAVGGLELNPWQLFGFTFEAGFVFSKFFEAGSQNYTQVGGKASVGAIYRF